MMPTLEDLRSRCDAIEEAYEFMLAYAGQGLSDEQPTAAGGIRDYLQRCDTALSDLADFFRDLVAQNRLHPSASYDAFIAVLDRDARDAQASVRLVLAQPSIGSQLIDNLNASIHLRALLTDLFLIDEILRPRAR